MAADDNDGWEDLVGPTQFETPIEMRLSEFCQYAKGGNIEKLKEMLDTKLITDINLASPQKRETVLHYACISGSLEVVKFLVERGSDVNLKDIRLKHGLHLASSAGSLEIVKYLVEKNSSLSFVDKYSRSCIHWTIIRKHFDVFLYLLEAGAPVYYKANSNWQPIHEAAKCGDTRFLEKLIKSGATVNNETVGKSRPVTPLHVAAREGHVDCLKLLLKNKAQVNAINEGKQTPLHKAAFRGSKDCCRELILYGADPHAKDNLGRTPLLDACNQGKLGCAIHCLDAGGFVNQRDHMQNSPLHHLLKFQSKTLDQQIKPTLSSEQLASFTDVLLQYGANPNLSNEVEETPCMIAMSFSEKDVLNVIYTALEKPRTLRHIAKIKCHKFIRCDEKRVWTLPIPKTLQLYLLQNSSYFSGW